MSAEPEAPGGALILGTAQFGSAYGIAGRDEGVPEAEVREILELAAAHGVRALDTAPVYGDIEPRLSALCSGLPLDVITKIPPVPEVGGSDAVRRSVERSRARLGDRLAAVLFHRAEDLSRPDADRLWRTAQDVAGSARLGASCYDPETAVALRERFGVSLFQLPANVFDQRLGAPDVADGLAGVEIHARSVFLQGLLLMSEADVAHKLPNAAEAHGRWTRWCRERGVPPVAAALAIVRALPGVRYCVVGADNAAQFREVLESVEVVAPRGAAALASQDPNVIDPRRWNAAPVAGAS